MPALPAGHVQIAYAVTDQVVVIGSGPGFVKHVLDTTAGTSLAANERYKKLADRVGPSHGHDLRRHHRHPRPIEKAVGQRDPAALKTSTRPTSSRSSTRSTR